MDPRLAGLAAALLLGASGVHAVPVSKEAYRVQGLRIEAEYDAARTRCKPLEGSAREVCREQARGARDVRQAELALQYQPTPDNDEKLRIARAEAAYAVSLQRCKPLDGSAREVCRQDAREVLADARAEARLQKEVVAQEMKSDSVVAERSEREEKMRAAAVAARTRPTELPRPPNE